MHNLLVAFWQCVKDDLAYGGVTTDDGLPYSVRRLDYRQRVIIELEQIKLAAAEFIDSPDFLMWADLSGLDPQYLREALVKNADNL